LGATSVCLSLRQRFGLERVNGPQLAQEANQACALPFLIGWGVITVEAINDVFDQKPGRDPLCQAIHAEVGRIDRKRNAMLVAKLPFSGATQQHTCCTS